VRAAALAAVAALLVLVPAARAQDADEGRLRLAAPLPPLAGAVDPDHYRVGPGDQFLLSLWGPLTRTVPLTVGPEGVLLVPEFGSLAVAGLTLTEARTRMLARIRERLRGVDADLRLTQPRQFRVRLTGAVRVSGAMLATGGMRLGELLADSLLLPDASRRDIQLIAPTGERRAADLARVREAGDLTRDPLIVDGEVVHVPVATRFVGAWGGVARQGAREFLPGDSVLTLLRLAGGLLPDALPARALLLRWRSATENDTLRLDLGADSPDLARTLTEGDQLHVFRTPSYLEAPQVTLVGRLHRVGVFPVERGRTRVSDVIARAGGFLPDADRSALRLVRRGVEAGGDPEFDRLVRLSREEMTASEYASFRTRLAALSPQFRIDASAARAGDWSSDALLEDGDVLRVERTASSVRVDGQVLRPGLVAFESGRDWSYYLGQAGGYSGRAARTQVRVTRAADGKTVRMRDAGAVSPGDFMWVPERPDVSPWAYVREGLVVVAQVATLILAVRN
jgi:protein involved in polysaccharide export with SLBB domain